MLKFVGKRADFERFMKFVKAVFGEGKTIKEILEGTKKC